MSEFKTADMTLPEVISDLLAKGVTYSPGFDSVRVQDARAFVGKLTELIVEAIDADSESRDVERLLREQLAKALDILRDQYDVLESTWQEMWPPIPFAQQGDNQHA